MIDVDLTAEQLERLARVDSMLRTAAGRLPKGDCERTRASMSAALDGEASEVEVKSIRNHLARCQPCQRFLAGAARLAMVLRRAPTAQRGRQKHELRLSPAELTLIYKSLEAAKTLRVVPPQDELLEDTMQLVDQALRNA